MSFACTSGTRQGGSVHGARDSHHRNCPRSLNRDEAQLRILQLIQAQPEVSQREMARALGLSLGKTNYCLRALVDRGLVKARNFRSSRNKAAYAYRLTPAGMRERVRATLSLLERKSAEYDALREEISTLRRELDGLADGIGPGDRRG